MNKNKILDIWEKNSVCINGWLSLPNSFTAEAFGKMGWDTITIDMQHGQNDYQSSIAMLQALSNSQSVPMVRIPWSEPGIIMRMLDLGVMGIIAPMINSKKECENFVKSCRYAPLGYRSFGPTRASIYSGSDYSIHANEEIITMAKNIKNNDIFSNKRVAFTRFFTSIIWSISL